MFCLNTTQLECFAAVANFLNFSRAAEVLRISFQLLMLHPIRALGVLLPLVGGIALALIAPGLIFFLPAPVCWLESRTIEAVFRLHMRPEDLERETA